MDRSMRYPSDFPAESRAAVAAEKLRAGRDFDVARENSPATRYGAGLDLHAELRRYILRPFAVFVSEACKLGRKGIWHVDRIQEEALEFLRLSTIDAKYSKGYDKADRQFAQDWIDSSGGGGIKPEVMRQLERSAEWQQFQEALLQVAESQSTGASTVDGTLNNETGTITRDPAQRKRIGGTLSAEEDKMPAQEFTGAATDQMRSALVEAFLLECNRESARGFKVIRRHIWQAAGHTHARQFQYWQEQSEKATAEDDRNFRRILSMSPAEFIELLKKKGIAF